MSLTFEGNVGKFTIPIFINTTTSLWYFWIIFSLYLGCNYVSYRQCLRACKQITALHFLKQESQVEPSVYEFVCFYGRCPEGIGPHNVKMSVFQYFCLYERKCHCSVNRFPHLSFVARLLTCCSVCAALLSLCCVAHLCRVAQFVQYLCTGDIEQRIVTQSWQYLG